MVCCDILYLYQETEAPAIWTYSDTWQYCDFDNICIIVQPYYDLNEVGLPLENIQFDPIMIC